jgi:hypothetical protein
MVPNWIGQIPPAVAALITFSFSCAVLIKDLEGFVKILTRIFPKLKTLDGELLGVAAWVDAFSKSKWLNAFALSPAVAFHEALNPPAQDITAHSHAVIVNAAEVGDPPPALAKQASIGNGGFISPALALAGAMLAFGLILALNGCATVPGRIAIACEEQGIQSQLPQISSQVTSILGGNSPNWQDALDSLLASQGTAVICAVEALVGSLTSRSAALPPHEELVLVRSQVWLNTHPHAPPK